MNNSGYISYGERIFYQFKDATFTIPVKITPHIEIQLTDTITWAPKQTKEKVDMNTYTIFENDLSLISLMNRARPNIHNPYNVAIDDGTAQRTKQERLGFSSASSSSSGRRFVFTRGLKNVE
jgi:hypothetical protein